MNHIIARLEHGAGFHMTYRVTYDSTCPSCAAQVPANTQHSCESTHLPFTILPQRTGVDKKRGGA